MGNEANTFHLFIFPPETFPQQSYSLQPKCSIKAQFHGCPISRVFEKCHMRHEMRSSRIIGVLMCSPCAEFRAGSQ